jgi:hypothetical protein
MMTLGSSAAGRFRARGLVHKDKESRWRGGVPAARLSSSRVDWLAQPIRQIWRKIVSAVLHELFQLCFSRCAYPPITRRPKFLPRVPFSQHCLKIDNKRLFEERICQVHVSLVGFNRHSAL